MKYFFIISSSKIVKVGITFTNAKCTKRLQKIRKITKDYKRLKDSKTLQSIDRVFSCLDSLLALYRLTSKKSL